MQTQQPVHHAFVQLDIPKSISNWRNDWKLVDRMGDLGIFTEAIMRALTKFKESNSDSLEFPPMDDPMLRHLIHVEAKKMGFHSFSHGEASTRQVTVFKEGVNPANLRGFTPGQTFGQEAPTDTKVYEDIRHRLKKQNELLEHEFQNQLDDWLRNFRDDESKDELVFPPLEKKLRRIVHEQAELFGMECLSYGFGDHRSPVVYKKGKAPTNKLSLMISEGPPDVENVR